MALEIIKLECVQASDVFKDCWELWSLFAESDPDMSWGNNSFTLVSAGSMLGALDNIDDYDDKQLALVEDRLTDLEKGGIYVNLEG